MNLKGGKREGTIPGSSTRITGIWIAEEEEGDDKAPVRVLQNFDKRSVGIDHSFSKLPERYYEYSEEGYRNCTLRK